MRLLTLTALLLGLFLLAPRAASSQTATPTATPPIPTVLPPEGGCPVPLTAGKCRIGPCDRSAVQPPAHFPAPRYARTPQGIPIRLQQLPGAAAVTGMAVNSGRVAWATPEFLGPRHTIRPRLFLARLDGFHPSVIASPPCSTVIFGPSLSPRWLVWIEAHLTPFGRHDVFTIRAVDLQTRQTVSWSYPSTDVFPPGVGLSGDTIIWTHEQWEGRGAGSTLVFGTYIRTLPDGPVRAIQVVREHIGRFIPPSYVEGYVDPQIAGNLAVWERSRSQNGMPRTDVMAATLPNGPVRVLAWGGAESLATNGWKVAWLEERGDSFDLALLDARTGARTVVGHNVLIWAGSPQLGGSTLSWQSGSQAGSSRYLLVRDLRTGRQYTLVHWLASGATPTALRAIGPGRADGNRVAWEEIVRRPGQAPAAYLAIARIPDGR
jgi:hypothetical protein